MSRTAAEIRSELDEVTKLSWGYDQSINLLRAEQAKLNARRKELEIEFQRQDALEQSQAQVGKS